MSLLFDGVDLVAHHHPGDTPYLLVTFIGAYQEAEADRTYLLQEVAERDGIACVGVTHRTRNLYVSAEIDRIAASVRAIRKPGQQLVMLGQSGGGYAAIKYANRFGADYVLAFSPMYSLHEADLEIADGDRYTPTILRMSLRFHRIPPAIVQPGMRPDTEDCRAPVLIVHDTHNYNDNYAASLYRRRLPTARLVTARHMGHALFATIGCSGFVTEMLDRINRGDGEGAHAVMRRLVRNDADAIGELLVEVARRKPSMVPVALRTRRAAENLTPGFRRRHRFNTVLAYNLIARGRTADAYAHLAGVHPDLLSGSARPLPDAVDGDRPPGQYLVLSYHGDILGYDTRSREVRFSSNTLHHDGENPLLLDTRTGTPRFVVGMRVGEQEIPVDAPVDVPGNAMELPAAETGFTIVPITASLVALRRGTAFLRGERNGVPRFTAAEAQGWEQFALLPTPVTSAFRQTTALNWFEQVAITVSATRSLAAASPRRRRFRSVLQEMFT